MGTALIIPTTRNTSAEKLAEKIDPILTCLPSAVDRQQFVTAVIVAANELNKPCQPASVLRAAFNCAQLGLLPGAGLGLAYFIPYKGVCTLVIGYRGFIDLSFSNDFLRDIHADVILRGEEFRQWTDSDGPHIQHEIPLDRELSRENVVGAYSVYHTQRGGAGVVVVPRKELDAVDRSGDPKSNVWKTRYCEMAKKTPIRRAAKFWKITPRMALAISLDETQERGEPQEMIESLTDEKTEDFSLKDLEPGDGETSDPKQDAEPQQIMENVGPRNPAIDEQMEAEDAEKAAKKTEEENAAIARGEPVVVDEPLFPL